MNDNSAFLRFKIQTPENNSVGKKKEVAPQEQGRIQQKIKTHREIKETQHSAEGKDSLHSPLDSQLMAVRKRKGNLQTQSAS